MGVPLPPEALMASSIDPVLVVEVIGADRALGTNGDPPRVSLRVVEVLRGEFVAGDELHVAWPSFDDSFYAMRAGMDAYERWMAASLPAPERGERWIVMARRVPSPPSTPPRPGIDAAAVGDTTLAVQGRIRATAESRARVLEALGRR